MVFSRFFVYAAFLCLVACGGGGGGGSNGNDNQNDGNGFDLPTDSAQPLIYEGVTEAAVLNATNASFFIYSVLADSQGANITRDAVINNANLNNTTGVAAAKRFKLKALAYSRSKTALDGKPLHTDEGNGGLLFTIAEKSDDYDYSDQYTENCESGSVDYYILQNNDGTGKIAIEYKKCLIEGVLTDGLVIQNVHEFNGSVITHSTIRFNRLTNSVGGFEFIQSGSVEIRQFPETNREQRIVNLLYASSGSDEMVRLQDVVFDATYVDSIGSDTLSESISGRFYNSFLGYIDVTTSQSIEYLNTIPINGKLMLSGGNDSKTLLEFSMGVGSTFNVRLDADGDEVYEDTAIFNLRQLASEENADIRDDDGDGMHNSWEAHYGLDPQNAGDADVDTDEDSFSNLSEYRLGSSPDNMESTPSTADLEIALNSPGNQRFPVGHESSLNFWISNDGPELTEYAYVRITMPEEFQLLSASLLANVGSCEISGNIVNCEIIALGNTNVSLDFILPENLGNYSYEAAIVSSTLFDPDESNNIFSGQIEVWPATSELAVSFTTPTNPVPTVDNFSYVFEVENSGALPATDVQAEVEVAAGVTVIEEFLQDYCTLTGQTVVCTIASVPANSKHVESFSVVPPSTPGSITAHLTVTTSVPENDVTDNVAEHTREVITPISDLRLSFPVVNSTMPIIATGEQWFVQIQPRSNGPHILPQVEVTIDLPPGIDVVSAIVDNAAGECAGEHPIICTLFESSNNYRDIELALNSSIPDLYEFPITISGNGNDPDPSNNMITDLAYVGEPMDGIQALVDAAASGATVEVPANYYLGNLQYSKNINLVAVDGPENTFWVPQNIGLGITGATSGEVVGFTFAFGNAAIRLQDSNVSVHGNVFENLQEPSLYSFGTTSATIEGNTFRNTACDSALLGVIMVEDQSSPRIQNNVFLNNACTSVMFSHSGSPGIVVNNHFIDNDGAIEISSSDINAGAYVGNNIFYANGSAITGYLSCGSNCPAFQSNLLYGNDFDYVNMSSQTGINGNIDVDPLFTDVANRDYTLQLGSPAIDVGDILYAPIDDFEGNPRPVDGDASGAGEPDIGAYEFQ